MDLGERIIFMLIGGAIGFVLGLIVARLDRIKEELDEVIEREHTHDRNEDGFTRPNFVQACAIIAVLLTAWAAFSSQKASNDSADTQGFVVSLSVCNQKFLGKTITALNQRTEFSTAQAKANVELQKSQASFFSLLLGKPPASEKVRTDAAESYLDDLTNFVKISEQQKNAVSTNPYPSNAEYAECLAQDHEQSKENNK